MKSVIIVSVMTFVLIFGGVAFISSQIKKDPGPDPALVAERENLEALKVALDAEKAATETERKRLRGIQSGTAVQARALEDAMVRLQAMVTDLEARNEALSQEQEASADHLAKVYENMKPAQAAPIIVALDMETILDVMSRMRERQAARILASMPPATAAIISAGLSQGGRG